MSLASNLQNLSTRIATEFKTLRGTLGTLASLTTTDKSSFAAAINEVNAKPSGGGSTNLDGLSDVAVTTPTTGHLLRHNGTQFVNVLGTTFYDAAGSAAAAQSASQPLDADLTSLAALTTTAYGRAFNTLADQTALMALLSAATTTVPGKIALATNAEGIAGTDPAKAITSASLAAVFADRIDTNTALGVSNTKVPSQGAVKAYADGLLDANNAYQYKGGIDASTNPNYPAASAGWTYKVTVAGKIGGAAGPNVEAGDSLTALVDSSAAGTHAAVGANWLIVQTNIDGAVVGPASSVNGNLVSFSGTGGKVVADSGFSVDNDAALTANSNTRVPTQSAVKAYAQPADAELSAIAGLASAADRLPYFSGAGAASLAVFTAAGRALVDDVDVAAQRATLSVYSQAEIGNPETDFVATFEAGLL